MRNNLPFVLLFEEESPLAATNSSPVNNGITTYETDTGGFGDTDTDTDDDPE